ncbi:Undecaprenyl-phosphate mannosyltransferase [Streptomyces sp. YIM 121038]|uniref:glycosyltransferase n=1 Tax=Streptomyces sp. YIM 121038 TaxID=2136401 RepID=UPI00111091A3|nr:glycosyltransferase family 2 protein [Streptomyces sp. YIM 121038]QCX80403.1 Undecaprenyl-phosphate mannosyltransferase [Streptomyces sp. YIM 121038]
MTAPGACPGSDAERAADATVSEGLGHLAPDGVRTTVTVIIPTFNEADNVEELLTRLAAALPGHLDCEALFVDDSTDDTPAAIERAALTCPFPVNVIHRETPTGGLSGAVVEGMKAAASEWLVVMDADLQHPPSLLPELIETGRRTGAELVVASRYAGGGSHAGLSGRYRVAVSRTSTLVTKSLFPSALRGISDPMSGFFAIRRATVHAQAGILKPLGYKILLELAIRCRPRTVAEVPFSFQERYAGESKSTVREGLRFLNHLVSLRTATPVARIVAFGVIGLTGFVPNLLGLAGLTAMGLHYLPAEIVANQFGVLWNFVLIDLLLFRGRREHRHWADRLGRFALLANADLLLRIPLIALLVDGADMAVLPATAIALLTTFVVRFVATELLVYLPARGRSKDPDGSRAREEKEGREDQDREKEGTP